MIELRQIRLDEVRIRERARKDMGDLQPLMNSMAEVGLVQAISVDPDGTLHDGERRCRAALMLGWTTIPAMVIDAPALRAEYDANEIRKAFTPSERVALAKRIEAEIGDRQGQRTDKGELVADLPEVKPGQRTRDIAAKKAGFSSTTQYRQGKAVVEHGAPDLVAAMDGGDISISAAHAQLKPEEAKPPKLPTPKQAMEIAKTQPGLCVPARDGRFHCHVTEEQRELGAAYMALRYDILGDVRPFDGGKPLDPALAARAVPPLFAADIARRAEERCRWLQTFITLWEKRHEPS